MRTVCDILILGQETRELGLPEEGQGQDSAGPPFDVPCTVLLSVCWIAGLWVDTGTTELVLMVDGTLLFNGGLGVEIKTGVLVGRWGATTGFEVDPCMRVSVIFDMTGALVPTQHTPIVLIDEHYLISWKWNKKRIEVLWINEARVADKRVERFQELGVCTIGEVSTFSLLAIGTRAIFCRHGRLHAQKYLKWEPAEKFSRNYHINQPGVLANSARRWHTQLWAVDLIGPSDTLRVTWTCSRCNWPYK